MCICRTLESGREPLRSAPVFYCRTVRQLRLTPPSRLANQARKWLTLCCTKALVPKHWFPVASCLAQPQTASSALKSGL